MNFCGLFIAGQGLVCYSGMKGFDWLDEKRSANGSWSNRAGKFHKIL